MENYNMISEKQALDIVFSYLTPNKNNCNLNKDYKKDKEYRYSNINIKVIEHLKNPDGLYRDGLVINFANNRQHLVNDNNLNDFRDLEFINK